ncbi:PilZ domain-containing protein [Desulfuromonas acetexigens]|uniref:PilZ domain-containing protein n=1 Tax=Trichloromonas acetexigens TaxID=38815 RepID=A0A550JAV1_9BACT|nr:PilZ domain-containing protein [Desulfuromonas acetexigens]TRO80253.1 PilZ domain-containing protein [Desulfuromonas acetexigens]
MLDFVWILPVFWGVVLLVWLALQRRKAARRTAEASVKDARKFPRGDVHWPVSIETRTGTRQGVTGNASPSGLFICLDPPLELGQLFSMTILGPRSREIKVKARVVWSLSGTKESEAQTVPGMGIMFTEISQEDRIFLRTLGGTAD